MKNPAALARPRGFCLAVFNAEKQYQRSDKAAESNETDTQHQQSQDGQAVLVEGRDAFEEGRVGDGAAFGLTYTDSYTTTRAIGTNGTVIDTGLETFAHGGWYHIDRCTRGTSADLTELYEITGAGKVFTSEEGIPINDRVDP